MTEFSRQRCLKIHGVETFACFLITLCIPLSMLLVPVLIVGLEYETCDEEIELCEEFAAASEHRQVRLQRELQPRLPWRFWNSLAGRTVRINQDFPLAGHRLKHDLLAPLTC